MFQGYKKVKICWDDPIVLFIKLNKVRKIILNKQDIFR